MYQILAYIKHIQPNGIRVHKQDGNHRFSYFPPFFALTFRLGRVVILCFDSCNCQSEEDGYE